MAELSPAQQEAAAALEQSLGEPIDGIGEPSIDENGDVVVEFQYGGDRVFTAKFTDDGIEY